MNNIISYLLEWITKNVEKPTKNFNGYPPCPFARKARLSNEIDFLIIENNIEEEIIKKCINFDKSKKICITILNSYITPQWTSYISQIINKQLEEDMLDYIVLTDHYENPTYINGFKTSQEKYILFLIQEKTDLQQKAEYLEKNTNYYSLWSDENFNDIKNWRK